MADTSKKSHSAADLIPPGATLPTLQKIAAGCRACPLWKLGKQTVFGEGSSHATIFIVGEQPGFQEDLAGRPFVGPAGQLLDRALAAAGIDRQKVYVTNAVKHFKWMPKGKRHIHKSPNSSEITACKPWLEAELACVQPDVVVCLGATAAKVFLGNSFRVTQDRGKFLASPLAAKVLATVHPSSLLRVPNEADRHREIKRFIADLTKLSAKG